MGKIFNQALIARLDLDALSVSLDKANMLVSLLKNIEDDDVDDSISTFSSLQELVRQIGRELAGFSNKEASNSFISYLPDKTFALDAITKLIEPLENIEARANQNGDFSMTAAEKALLERYRTIRDKLTLSINNELESIDKLDLNI